MTISPLINYQLASPNNSGMRSYEISRITPHCTAGKCTIEQLGKLFSDKNYKASSNYGIDEKGNIGCFVDENYRSWCSSNSDNDNKAITIECSSDNKDPYYINDIVFDKLIDLCVDICKRYSKTKLLWLNNKELTLKYQPAENELILTVHRWFAAKACPGDYLYNRLGDVAAIVTSRLAGAEDGTLYRVQVGAFKNKKNAEALLNELKLKGYDAFITH